jgi:hypothetical protein
VGKYFFAALLAGAAMPAQALNLTTYIDATEKTISFDGEVSQSLGVIPLKIWGSSSASLNGQGADKLYFFDSLQASIMGSKMVVELKPDYFLLGDFLLTLNFDQAIEPGFSNLSMLNLVSGSLFVQSTGRYFPDFPITEVTGPVVSLAIHAPEPATWGLMIGGFALAGGAMRRRNYRVSFA